jgi:2-polyprenyl-3-methyl-5-hydroxy-6-metoxy-1,4-benzoquinol methylase
MSLTPKTYWDAGYHRGMRSKHVMVDPNRDYFVSECLDFITPYLPVATMLKPVRLLEMGCGNSLWLPFFAKTWNYQVNGIDYSEDGCQLAQANLAAVGCRGDIFCTDFTNLGPDFQDKFEIVISLGVVEHFENTSDIVGYFVRCLKPGGMIITIVPNMVCMMGNLQKLVSKRVYQVHVPLDLDALVRAHSDHSVTIQKAGYLMYMGLGMIDLSDRPYKRLVGKIIFGLDMLHLYIRRLIGFKHQSSSWSSFVIVIARRGEV